MFAPEDREQGFAVWARIIGLTPLVRPLTVIAPLSLSPAMTRDGVIIPAKSSCGNGKFSTAKALRFWPPVPGTASKIPALTRLSALLTTKPNLTNGQHPALFGHSRDVRRGDAVSPNQSLVNFAESQKAATCCCRHGYKY